MLVISSKSLLGNTVESSIGPHTSSIEISLEQHEISGKVIDKETGEPIPYCSIAVESLSLGTASNELGEFTIRVDSIPAKLIFSHIGYGQVVVDVSTTSELIVVLEPYVSYLEEVVVLASKKDSFARDLVKKAYEKADNAANRQLYGKALYRQKTKNGGDYSEFSEIFYDIRYTSNGIADWNIIEGRYALKDDAVHNRNYTLLTRLLQPLQPNTEELIFPLHPAFEVYYDVAVNQIIQTDRSRIAVVHFKPLGTIKTPIFEGDVYIDTKNHRILQINGGLSRDDLKILKLSTNNGYWKDYTLAFEIVYKPNDDANLLDHIKVDQEFDYYKNDNLLYRSVTTSNLTFYEHYSPNTARRLGGQITRNQSDWENLDEIGYNEQFWATNPIIKRTPVEEEVINAFERDNAFSSIFLNSAENIALLESNLSENPFIVQFTQKVNDYNGHYPIEKVFLHTDKDLFISGESIWFSAYGVIGPFHELTSASKVLHLDLIAPNNTIILSQTHELLNGLGSGVIELPKNLVSGNYQLRAYTQWMRNFDPDFFFTKQVEILNNGTPQNTKSLTNGTIDLQFFPEGGHAVDGIASKIAFKAIGNNGEPEPVKGRIYDSNGNAVAELNTFDRGAGFFQLIPKKNLEYTAVLNDGSKYPLPKILKNGYAMSVNNMNERSIKVIVQASASLKGQPFYIIGHMRQRKYYQGIFEFRNNQIISFEIPKHTMPSGVLTLSLFDSNKTPRCERALFVDNDDKLVITANIENQRLFKRGKVNMSLMVTDSYGKPVSGNFSIAVTDQGQFEKDPGKMNILTQLLLQSDVKGHIEYPNQLFQDRKRSTLNKLDLVMLTHGWRKFPWQEVWNDHYDQKEFGFAKGLTIKGKATRTNKKPLANTTLNVIAKSGDLLGMFSAKTAFDGSFSIDDFNFKGPTDVVFNAFDVKNKPLDVKIVLEDKQDKVPRPSFKSREKQQIKDTETYRTHAIARQRMETIYESQKVTELDEVVVTEEKNEKSRNQSPSFLGQTPDATLYTADHPAVQTVLQLVSLFNGVTVSGNSVSIRNQGPPLWVLNGIPIPNENPSPSTAAIAEQRAARNSDNPRPQLNLSMERALAPGPAPYFVTTMDALTVERVEVLKGASAAIWGSRGANGVILIYTKKGEGRTYEPTLSPDFTIFGHAVEKEFYSPKYDMETPEHIAPDYRATLFWNPNIKTDKNGRANIEFFNSDNAKKIQVSIEGLSQYGIPGSNLTTFGKQ